jgi:hypothetical protein
VAAIPKGVVGVVAVVVAQFNKVRHNEVLLHRG